MPAAKDTTATAYLQDPFPAPGKVVETDGGALDITDIRRDLVESDLRNDVAAAFEPKAGQRQLPTLLLYDEQGLQLFEKITYLEEYYLTNREIQLLEKIAAEIADAIPAGSMLIELGSGNLRKVSILLHAFEAKGKAVDYYALDLSRKELERTLAQVPRFEYVSCHGLLGTYDDGVVWLENEPSTKGRPKCVISLGSSIGNFDRGDAAEFLKGFANAMQPSDSMMVAIDACVDPDKVYHAYNDSLGVTHEFILNGLTHANRIYNEEIFHVPDWRVIGEYVYDEEGGRHQAFIAPIRDTVALGNVIPAGERVKIEQSLKYSHAGSSRLFRAAGLIETKRWPQAKDYGLHFLRKSRLPVSLNPSTYASGALPTTEDWETLWEAWDTVTLQMLPQEELGTKPIKLRNACIFYLGHIPTFLDIQLTKTTAMSPTDPASFYSIFERGIDPDVDNPEQCHDHSEIPDEWPPVNDILAYQNRVRARLGEIYAAGGISRSVGRAIWLGFEHEIMHLETLLYMMLQSDKTSPPLHAPRPDFEALANVAKEAAVPNEWFKIPEQEIVVGMDDAEDGTDTSRHYGWDNEKPARQVRVHPFKAKGRAITNEEYARYIYNAKVDKFPASWQVEETSETATNGENGATNGHADGELPESFLQGKSVRTVYGPVPLKHALEWPVFASYDELASCAVWMGGRIPTFEEARSIYAYVDMHKKDVALSKLTKKVPAVNGHLVNDGVEETPPQLQSTAPSVENGDSPAPSQAQDTLFLDLAGSNAGFAAWHPTEVSSRGGSLAGQAGMGGVWEWTSTPFAAHEGFEPMPMYPGYSADFFDGKHNIVLGGSWATHPRIAGRRSFVNWYQRNYPYAWAGARLVSDV